MKKSRFTDSQIIAVRRCGGANPALVAWFIRTRGLSTPAMTGAVSWRPMAWCAA